MAFTYSAGTTTDLNRVRLAIWDVVEATAYFTDEELDDFLLQESGISQAAAAACDALVARFSRDGFDFSADGSSFKKSQRVQHYRDLAITLRKRGAPDVIDTIPVDGWNKKEVEAGDLTSSVNDHDDEAWRSGWMP